MPENEKDSFFDHFGEDKPTKLGNWLVSSTQKQIFDFAQIQQGYSVLEIGPGRGIFADVCLERGIEYYAIAPNEQMAKTLEQKGVNVIREKVPPLPKMNRTFDTVVMTHVMEHMNSLQDALQTTQQIKEVLKPKGRLVICSPDYLSWRLNFFNCDFSHNYVTSRRRLIQLLVNAGFKDIKSCYMSGPLTGFVCFFLTALVSRLPLRLLKGLFPDNKVFYKLYKIQLTFSRNVLIL